MWRIWRRYLSNSSTRLTAAGLVRNKILKENKAADKAKHKKKGKKRRNQR
jgi:hypothetical protein